MPLTNGEIFAGYKIIRLLGSGGTGEVYLAQHPRLPRRDALKLLPRDWSADAEYRARFNREADLTSTLWHPHIVGVHDRGEEAEACTGPNCRLHRIGEYAKLPGCFVNYLCGRSSASCETAYEGAD